MIRLHTQRFGWIERGNDASLSFPGGIYGFELVRKWLLLGDQAHGALYWLQSADGTDLSFTVVDPREFVSAYKLCVQRTQLDQLWGGREPLVVLSVLTQFDGRLVLNLRNPIIINPALRVGRQVVATDAQPVHHELPADVLSLKQSA